MYRKNFKEAYSWWSTAVAAGDEQSISAREAVAAMLNAKDLGRCQKAGRGETPANLSYCEQRLTRPILQGCRTSLKLCGGLAFNLGQTVIAHTVMVEINLSVGY